MLAPTPKALLSAGIDEHRRVLVKLLASLETEFERVVSLCTNCLRSGGKLLLFGNGGSAADAQHLAAELVVRFERNRGGLAAIALPTDSSILTACGNDFGFERIFQRQIEALGRPGDVAIGITTSGKSPNIIAALTEARTRGLKTVCLSGERGGQLALSCDAALLVPSGNTARVQEMHILLGHLLCQAIEWSLGETGYASLGH